MASLIQGATLMHEHMHLDLSRIKKDPDTCLDCTQETLEELRKLRKQGITRILDVTNTGMGRDHDLLDWLEQESGIRILHSTGWYKDPFIPDEWSEKSPEELADAMIREIRSGKAVVIGEIGTSKNRWTDNERRLFEAAVLAHKATGAPVYTHTTLSTLALEQAQYLTGQGVDPDKIVIGHMDLAQDMDRIRKVLKTGVNIGFDTIGKSDYLPDEKRVQMLLELEAEGLIDHVVLSMDITRKSQLQAFGGKGYPWLADHFIPSLLEAGLQPDTIRQMLIRTPDRILGEQT
ncbi:phosphotriesterase family protein [Faecalibaculum rodentium]|uniref:phosphotriesterase family protein n=1 Tax=Faecalibaculum rodentium TaxID=1702221 RepID=UPI00263A2B19|nr:TatD family hydrolase [Faecalibaculum rodentium]